VRAPRRAALAQAALRYRPRRSHVGVHPVPLWRSGGPERLLGL